MGAVWKLHRALSVVCAFFGVAVLSSGCVSIADGPERLYPVAVETQAIRDSIPKIDFVEFVRLSEPDRIKFRNDLIAARMYAIDIQYTAYEAALTRDRQGVGFGTTVATLGLTTASGLMTPVVTKNVLTGLAGVVTGSRAAYDNDVLFAHSVQWIQTQMRTQRTFVAERILRGMKLSTADYPMAAALTDLEDYYRAGTFTAGLLGTSEALGAEARLAEDTKGERIEVSFVRVPAAEALRACLRRPGVTEQQLVGLMTQPSRAVFFTVLGGKSPEVAEILLQRARARGICA